MPGSACCWCANDLVRVRFGNVAAGTEHFLFSGDLQFGICGDWFLSRVGDDVEFELRSQSVVTLDKCLSIRELAAKVL